MMRLRDRELSAGRQRRASAAEDEGRASAAGREWSGTLTVGRVSPKLGRDRGDAAVKAIARQALFCAAALMACVAPASAQDWPTRNVTVVVPLGAGSASDVLARVVLDQVGKQLGQTFVIENRPGAGGTIGANIVAKSAPDGYTMLAYGALASAHALYSKLPYDTLNDFIPVIAFGQQPLAVTTSPSKGFKTLRDLIAFGKAYPGRLNFSSAGVGSATHFAAERLRVAAGFEAQHIPFKGAQDSLTEIMSGRVDFSVQTFTSTLPHIRQGKLLALAVSAHDRSSAMPDVPTVIEAGLSPDSVHPFYSALFVPAKTPRDIVEKLHRETAKALEVAAVRERLALLGVEPMPMNLDELGKFFTEDVAANVVLANAAKIKIQ
jgi:tripartite-type tricarboxylate transporter receptor subunit TctC